MKNLILILTLFFSAQAYSSEQVLTCGFLISNPETVKECLENPKDEVCQNPLPGNQFMIPQFEIWLASEAKDYSMTYFNNGFLNIFGVVFKDFKALRPVKMEDKKMELAFTVDVTNKFQESMEPQKTGMLMDLNFVGKLENKPGKVYYTGLLKPEPADDDIENMPFACSYQ